MRHGAEDGVEPAARLESLRSLADGMLIDVFAKKDTFMLDMSAPAEGEDLTVLVDKRAGPSSKWFPLL